MINVVKLSDSSGSPFHLSIEDALKNAIDSIKIGAIKPTKCVLVFLDDSGNSLDMYQTHCRLTSSQAIGLLEMAKLDIYSDMGREDL